MPLFVPPARPPGAPPVLYNAVNLVLEEDPPCGAAVDVDDGSGGENCRLLVEEGQCACQRIDGSPYSQLAWMVTCAASCNCTLPPCAPPPTAPPAAPPAALTGYTVVTEGLYGRRVQPEHGRAGVQGGYAASVGESFYGMNTRETPWGVPGGCYLTTISDTQGGASGTPEDGYYRVAYNPINESNGCYSYAKGAIRRDSPALSALTRRRPLSLSLVTPGGALRNQPARRPGCASLYVLSPSPLRYIALIGTHKYYPQGCVTCMPGGCPPAPLELWVTPGAGTYEEMQAECVAYDAAAHLVVPANDAERRAAVAAVQASPHGDVNFWVGYVLPRRGHPGNEKNYGGENGKSMEQMGYWQWDSNCGKCGSIDLGRFVTIRRRRRAAPRRGTT